MSAHLPAVDLDQYLSVLLFVAALFPVMAVL